MIASAITAIATAAVPLPVAFLLSLVIGASFAGLTFVAHETLHGGIVRGRRMRHAVGWFCFVPFVLSPRLWVAWHNKIHHGNTGLAGADPDAYPTLAEYESSRHVRVATDHFSLGRWHLGGALTLLLGFTIQSAQMLTRAAAFGMSPRERRLALLETALSGLFWCAVALGIGFVPFVFAFLLPLVVANVIVMAFIITNHSLSPLTKVNDPLVNSLSVTAPRWVEWVTLRFGYHVEHHLFPAMSSRRAPEVRALLRARFPERYQSMSLARALYTMACTGRVYKDDTTLLDPRTGHEWRTLGAPAAAVAIEKSPASSRPPLSAPVRSAG